MTIVRTKPPAGEPLAILSEEAFERLRSLPEETEDGRVVAASRARLEAGIPARRPAAIERDEAVADIEVDARLARAPRIDVEDLVRQAG
ncbi:putative phage-related transcriptional regulator [Methylobacterium sp. 4-46]|uniref:hypothetical protein n=1 Tax=unclassified Methylobacterium TaxID=2615210 RepID=UPI000152E236|nr:MULTISPECIES: hypothetical protein [Methylobacterium]ACA20952.1 putative phage-related transcriptional regulator [Methylobacterium sp. 4-46]WFT80108.1 hypothetical protein QA634_33850 [Methylobacterium nodulans]